MNKDTFIRDTFIKLTNRTYPHGTEKEIFHLLNDKLTEDEFGNLFIKIGENDVMFTSHLDTATSALTKVNHVFDKKIIRTDGKSILGADDKAGVSVMLYMIENKVPGLYYFFVGEEVGCVGSRKLANKLKTEKIEGINKVISFDRRGTNSIITHQSGQRCSSDKFGESLASELNRADSTFSYKIDDTGVLTDSVQFIKIYSECTNISVGYQNEHTFAESQDIEHLTKLARACVKVNWENLPVERDPTKKEYKSYGSSYSYGGYGGYRNHWDDDYDSYDYYDYTKKSNRSKVKNENIWFFDEEFNYVSNVKLEKNTKKYVSVDLCDDRVSKEKLIIEDLLKSLELDFLNIYWDGMKLLVNYGNGKEPSEADRNELIEFLPEIDYKYIGDDELDAAYSY
jgi:hypothetical protein